MGKVHWTKRFSHPMLVAIMGACVAGVFGIVAVLLSNRPAPQPPDNPPFLDTALDKHSVLGTVAPSDSSNESGHRTELSATVMFDIANTDFFEPDEDRVETDGSTSRRGWNPTNTHELLATIIRRCVDAENKGGATKVADYLRWHLAYLKPSDVERDVITKLLDDYPQEKAALKRKLFPVFDVVIANSSKSELLTVQSVDTRIHGFTRFAGDAGDVPTGGVVPTVDEVVVKLANVDAYGDGTFRFKEPLTRHFRLKSIVVPAGGAVQVRVIVEMPVPSGEYDVSLRFGTSRGPLETTAFGLTIL